MAKAPLAVVTMSYNEPDFMPIWLKYYSRQVPLNNLYVIDHGSTDGSALGLEPVNMVRLQRSPFDETERCAFVSGICNGLLHFYDAVLYTDVDEILVADPRHYEGLVDFCQSSSIGVTTALGMHVAHDTTTETEINPLAPILSQRRWALGVGSMSKPTLIRRPTTWGPGFHYANAPTEFTDLFLFHLAYYDIPTVRRRQRKRLLVERASNHGEHHGAPVSEFVEHLRSWFNLPRIERADLGRDCEYRAGFVKRLFETRTAGNGVDQIDAMVTEASLWQIPERFRECL